ncbi:MAG: winged helix-turn-helix domain-containing protein [Pyrinomonadaceae bacterium]
MSSKKFQILDKLNPDPVPAAPAEPAAKVYRFGPFTLDTAERALLNDGAAQQLTPKAFDTLLALVENGGRLMSKDALLDAIWPDTFVEEKTLAQNIFTLRKVLGAGPEDQPYIETVPKSGYRFRAQVTRVDRPNSVPVVREPQTVLEYPATVTHSATVLAAAPEPTSTHWLSRKRVMVALILLMAVGSTAFLVYRFLPRAKPLSATAFQKFTIARLTNGGNVKSLGLSPDGKFVAYAAERKGQQSLFVRQVDAGAALEIVPAAAVTYRGITFSRNGAWVYYVTGEPGWPLGALYQVEQLGGTPRRVLPGRVDSRIEFSPDGKQFAFVRWTSPKMTALMIANADGTGERQVAEREHRDGFATDGPAWSPDGKTIAVATSSYTGEEKYAGLLAVDVADGATHPLAPGKWNWIGQLTWLQDGSGLVMTAWDSASEVMSDQVWLLAFPGGEMRRVTNDINGYYGAGANANGSLIAAAQTTPFVNFWVAPNGDWTQAKKITDGLGDLFTERLGLSWMPDGRIVYSSWKSGNPDLWTMNADGSNQHQLTAVAGSDLQPAVTPDGRQIVFVSTRNGRRQLWRMNADGTDAALLSDVTGVRMPAISPDGQWVIYVAGAGDNPVLWRIPIAGGAPIQLNVEASYYPAIAPDGKSIAFLLPDLKTGQGKLTLIAFTDGKMIKQFDVQVPMDSARIRWSPDQKALTYVKTSQGVGNIWSQPLAGGPPQQLTDWKTDRIFRFDWSPDGRLLCERGTQVDDVILIRDVR